MDLTDALKMPPTAQRRRVDREHGVLIGSRCAQCGGASWPSRAICPRCGSAVVVEAPLRSTGTLVTYTTVWVPRPGLEPPYILGLVGLDGDPVTLFAHVRELPSDVRVPYPVQLVVNPVEDTIPPFWFEPRRTSPE